MWLLIIPIDTSMVYPHNEFTGAKAPKVPDESDVQVPVNHDFCETFERDNFDGKFVGKGELHSTC